MNADLRERLRQDITAFRARKMLSVLSSANADQQLTEAAAAMWVDIAYEASLHFAEMHDWATGRRMWRN